MAEVSHGFGDSNEASDVGPVDQISCLAVALGVEEAVLVNLLHNSLELFVYLLGFPLLPVCILLHLKVTHRDATGVCRLCGCKYNRGLFEGFDGFWGTGHIRALADEGASILDE